MLTIILSTYTSYTLQSFKDPINGIIIYRIVCWFNWVMYKMAVLTGSDIIVVRDTLS